MTIHRIKKFLDEGHSGYCQCDKPAESIPSAGKPQVCVICELQIKKDADTIDFLNCVIAMQEIIILGLIKQNNALCNFVERELRKNGGQNGDN